MSKCVNEKLRKITNLNIYFLNLIFYGLTSAWNGSEKA